jgi:aminocarboxymuconate-semialdehyde decarboxylase
MKIDCTRTFYQREWPDLDAKYGYTVRQLDHYKPCCAMMIGDHVFREITANVWTRTAIEEMERSAVSTQVLSTVPVMFSYWAKRLTRSIFHVC